MAAKLTEIKMTARRIAGMPELKMPGAKKMRTPVEMWTSFRVTSGDQRSAFLTSSAMTINVPNPKKKKGKRYPFRVCRRGK